MNTRVTGMGQADVYNLDVIKSLLTKDDAGLGEGGETVEREKRVRQTQKRLMSRLTRPGPS